VPAAAVLLVPPRAARVLGRRLEPPAAALPGGLEGVEVAGEQHVGGTHPGAAVRLLRPPVVRLALGDLVAVRATDNGPGDLDGDGELVYLRDDDLDVVVPAGQGKRVRNRHGAFDGPRVVASGCPAKQPVRLVVVARGDGDDEPVGQRREGLDVLQQQAPVDADLLGDGEVAGKGDGALLADDALADVSEAGGLPP